MELTGELMESYKHPASILLRTPIMPSTSKNAWSVLGLLYAAALADTKLPFRVISTNPAVLRAQDGYEEEPWFRLNPWFDTPIDEDVEINLVCTDPGNWGRFWVKGKHNVAITDVFYRAHREEDLKVLLKHYDAVWVRSWDVFRKLDSGFVNRAKVHVVSPSESEPLEQRLMEKIKERRS